MVMRANLTQNAVANVKCKMKNVKGLFLHFSFCILHFSLMPHEPYMHRCIQLAKLAQGHVAPNPVVGAVLVHNNRIIGEGYHQVFGQAHAEVNCIASVKEEDRSLVQHSTLYVSL